MENSWAMKELWESRNSKSAFKYGLHFGLFHNFLSAFIFKGKEPWHISNGDGDVNTFKTR